MVFWLSLLGIIFELPTAFAQFVLDADFTVNIDAVGYYTGYSIGMFIDVILSAVFTGGAKTVADVLRILGTQLKDLFKGIKKVAKSVGDEIAKKTALLFDDLIAIFARIRVGSKNIKPFLDEVLEWLKKLFQVEKNLLKIEKILFSTRNGIEKLGIVIVAKVDEFLLKWNNRTIFKGNQKAVEDFWETTLKPKLGSGTGGVLKYLKVLSRNVYAQEHNMSCAAACIRQLAKDKGIEITEETIRALARTTEETGTFPDGILNALKKIFKDKEVEAGIFYDPKISDVDMARIVSNDGSWISIIRPHNGKPHAIIIDRIVDGKVYIKDPWSIEGIGKGNGVEAIIDEKEFATIWAQGGNYVFKIK
jgi:predicted double-glycine peptidase